jgi:hypothetical protein
MERQVPEHSKEKAAADAEEARKKNLELMAE